MCWLAPDKLAQPKGLGGLGFKDIQTFNMSLLAKLPWRMLTNPDCLLSRILLGKYGHNSALLKVKPTKGASHGWLGILAGRDLLLSHLGIAIGEGTEIKVWGDSWISTSERCVPFGPPKEEDRDLRVSDLIIRGTCNWNKKRVLSIFPDFARKIFELRPSRTGARDAFIWFASTSGQYLTRSGCASAIVVPETPFHREPMPASFGWYRSVWKITTTPKFQLFICKAIQGALPTGDNLRKRGLMQNTNCVHCGMLETTEHIFLHCSFARQVWDAIPISTAYNPDLVSSFPEALVAAAGWICLPPCGITGDLFSWVCWSIWTSRNRLLFEARPAVTSSTASKTLTDAREWNLAQDSAVPQSKSTQIQGRQPNLPFDVVICNTDAAWNQASSAAGLAWIFDSASPLPVSDGCQYQDRVSSTPMAEGLDVREALSHALHLGITSVWLRSDSLSLIKAVDSITKPMNLYEILSDIESLSQCFAFCFFSFVPRDSNGLADSLEKATLFHLYNSWT